MATKKKAVKKPVKKSAKKSTPKKAPAKKAVKKSKPVKKVVRTVETLKVEAPVLVAVVDAGGAVTMNPVDSEKK